MEAGFPMRSLMFVPAHNLRLMDSAVRSIADVLLPDLEDSVLPSRNKQAARENIVDFAQRGLFGNHRVFPRVNDRESGELLRDITQLSIPGIDGFMYPKAQTGQDIFFFDKLLETVEYEKGLPVGQLKIIPLIETTSSVLHAEEICAASSRVIAIAFGCEDYLTDLQGFNDEQASVLFTPRSLIAIAAKSRGVIPIDTVHIRVHDLEDLERNLAIAKRLGFEGMLVLHPKELDLVHRYFTPLVDEVAAARQMVDAFEASEREGVGVALVGGRFVGPPLAKAAKKTLKRYAMIMDRQSSERSVKKE